jgi:hypothetical protein
MDHHVPAAITSGLRRRRVEVVTALEDGASAWTDERLLSRATELNRTIFSQDDDFLVEAHTWLLANRHFAGVVYGHQRRVTIGQAISDLELIAKVMDPIEMVDRVIFIPLR